jgi:hypothetical protein
MERGGADAVLAFAGLTAVTLTSGVSAYGAKTRRRRQRRRKEASAKTRGLGALHDAHSAVRVEGGQGDVDALFACRHGRVGGWRWSPRLAAFLPCFVIRDVGERKAMGTAMDDVSLPAW